MPVEPAELDQGRPGPPDPPAAPSERSPRADGLRQGPRRHDQGHPGPRVHRRPRRALERERRATAARSWRRRGRRADEASSPTSRPTSGSSNIPAVQLADQAHQTRLPEHAGGVLHLRAAPRPTSPRSRPRASTGRRKGKPDKVKVIARQQRLPRRHAAGDERHRHGALLEDVRAARARASSTSRRRYPYRSGGRQARRDGGPDRGAAAGGGDPPGGRRHGGGLHRRADPRRRRRALPDRRLLPAGARGLRRSTTCSSSPTRSSPASAGPASGSRSTHWNVLARTSCPSPRA